MFIELTDILRCPAAHDEQYLVLVPYDMSERMVKTGRLGCPACLREYEIVNGEIQFSSGGAAVGKVESAGVDGSALAALLGLSGPGGYVAMVGDIVGRGPELVAAVSGVHFLGINAPVGTVELPMLSLARADMIPTRSRSLRGVILGGPYAESIGWQEEAVRTVLPGLRIVGQGPTPGLGMVHVLAEAAGWWVGQRS